MKIVWTIIYLKLNYKPLLIMQETPPPQCFKIQEFMMFIEQFVANHGRQPATYNVADMLLTLSTLRTLPVFEKLDYRSKVLVFNILQTVHP